MAKLHGYLQRSALALAAKTQVRAQQASIRFRSRAFLPCLLLLSGIALGQPAPTTTAPQEQRRAEDRERALREERERTPDVRLPRAPAEVLPKLLSGEAPCFVINDVRLQMPEVDAPWAGRFASSLRALAGPEGNDSPLGRCIGAGSISVLIKRVQNDIISRGYVTTRVLAEPQDLKPGVLTITVMPGRIRAIRFSQTSGPRGNLWTAMPMRAGDLLNLRDVEQALENFKRVPTAEADIQIEPAEGPLAQPGQSDLVVTYRQDTFFRLSAFADDAGSKATGKYQGGVTLSHDNWFTLNDMFYAAFNQDLGGGLDGERGTNGHTVHYSVPFGYWLLGTTVSSSRYHQTVAGINQNYTYSGTSTNLDVKLSRLVYRDASRKTTLGVKAFKRTSNNFIDDTEIEVQRRKVAGYELSLNHREFIGTATLEGILAYKHGTGAFKAMPAPEEAFGEGTSRLQLSTVDVSLNAPFKAFDQRLRYNGTLRTQFNHTPLTPQDRFSIGSRYTVRGFDGETSLSADRGWLLRNDLSVALGNSGQEMYVGLDYGQVSGPAAEFLIGRSLTGAVVGLRGAIQNLQYDIFVGQPVSKPTGFTTARYTAGFSLNYSF